MKNNIIYSVAKFTAILSILAIFSINSYALSVEEHLSNEADEQRARKLFLEVRCLVCQGQVIESSDTEFSFEMRKLIRNKITQGKNDQEIKEELIAEFGEDILTSRRLNKSNLLLWVLPVIFAILPIFYLIRKN